MRYVMCTVFAALAFPTAVSRPPAVAGSFYPANTASLRSQVKSFLDAAPKLPAACALVVPHAGYPYSGDVAARAFVAIDGQRVRRVVLLGPSHHQSFAGGALPGREVGTFRTPMGEVPVDREALESLRRHADFAGPAEAHDPEHCLEVELPFLQVVAPNASIVPILVGARTDHDMTLRMAKALVPLLDDRTVVVVSSDFTHHGERYGWTPLRPPDLGDQLVHLARVTAERLTSRDASGFRHQIDVSGDTVCGARPAMVLAELVAHAFDGNGKVLEVTTSGHKTGSWELSVSYVAAAYFGKWREWREPRPAPVLGDLDKRSGEHLIQLARATLAGRLKHDGSVAEWFANVTERSELMADAGAFVTLNNRGRPIGDPRRLRACMGVIEARQPLVDAVIQAAVWATQDPRFPPLRLDELDAIDVEVSVLSPARPVAGPAAIEVGKHGVILAKGRHRAVFLPQVATEQGWDRDTMLDHLARKAGLPTDGWRDGARFEVFTAQVFGEHH